MNPEGNQQNRGISYRKKRILFVITKSEFGGAQRFLFNFISRLDRSKYELSVVVGAGDGQFTQTLKEKNIAIIVVDSLVRNISPRQDLKALRELKKILISVEPDTLFLLSSKAGFIGSLAARWLKLKTRVIYRIGGWTFNDPWPFWKKFLFFLLERLSAGWKNVIIVNNRHDFDQAKKLCIKPKENIELVYNGLDVYKMDFLPEDIARQKLPDKITGISEGFLQNKTIIGTIANFYPAKGLEYFLKTAEFFKEKENIIFIIIGDGPCRPVLEKLIAELELENKVFLAGRLPEASQYLSAFDIFYLASLKEGFPWALIEAMAAKLPVVATGVGAIPEIIQSGKSGLIIPPKDPQAAAKAIRTILESSKLGPELGIQGHQRVLFNFSPEKTMGQIEGLL